MKPVTVDFETEGIEDRPDYPPKPVGVAIKWPGRKAVYHAWGHPVGNTTDDYYMVLKELQKAWDHPGGVLFHNAKFDLEVARVHFKLDLPPALRVHDTMFLLFLNDPHSPDLHLKSSAERILGLPPSEQEEVRDWLIKHQPVGGIRISAAAKSNHPWGKYICMAPGDLVGRYACGDVERTALLFDKLIQLDEGMTNAYNRERRLLPHLMEMERQGVRVDLARLRKDVAEYSGMMILIDKWIYKTLGTTINIDSGDQLVAAMIASGKLDKAKLPRTPTGRYSTTKDALQQAVTDRTLLATLKYRTQLGTCLSTFMEPWLDTANRSGGLIFTSWHQTRSMDGGTRTGRLSSHPNFQNIPKTFEPIFTLTGHDDLPRAPIPYLPPLPLVRSYIVPWSEGDVLIDRDYSQQELRILAHYDDGEILARYHKNPRLDFHDEAKDMVTEKLGRPIERKPVKNMGFGLVYGMGLGKLSISLKVPVDEAEAIKRAYLAALPGIKDLIREMKERAARKEPIRTWGGRLYYCEEPRVVDGRLRTFDYKLLNVLIQGSAADCTKEATIRYCEAKPAHHRLLLTVHDEFLGSVPFKESDEGMEILRAAMESVRFDVPMLSDGKVSATNWAELANIAKERVDSNLDAMGVRRASRPAGGR